MLCFLLSAVRKVDTRYKKSSCGNKCVKCVQLSDGGEGEEERTLLLLSNIPGASVETKNIIHQSYKNQNIDLLQSWKEGTIVNLQKKPACMISDFCMYDFWKNIDKDVYTLEVGLLGEGAGGRVLPCVTKYYLPSSPIVIWISLIIAFSVIVNVFLSSSWSWSTLSSLSWGQPANILNIQSYPEDNIWWNLKICSIWCWLLSQRHLMMVDLLKLTSVHWWLMKSVGQVRRGVKSCQGCPGGRKNYLITINP